jgi:uncharacterized protein (TIGR02452 family)
MPSFPTVPVALAAGVAIAASAYKKMTRTSSDKGKGEKKASSSSSAGPSKQPGSPPNRLRRSSSGNEGKRERVEFTSRYVPPETRRDRNKRIAENALSAIDMGFYHYRDQTIPLDIKTLKDGTIFYAENSPLGDWKNRPDINNQSGAEASLSILNVSTLDAARILSNSYRFQVREGQEGTAPPKTGVLNFASATKPGGGFKNGADAQEESIARVSTLYASLISREGDKFYEVHNRTTRTGQGRSFYTHGMIYSPGVVVFQNDEGEPVDAYQIEVVSSAAVNAGELRSEGLTSGEATGLEVEIEAVMEERMGRILFLFEKMGVRNIVLGTFGTGVFKNRVDVIARLWARLLVNRKSRFTYSFDRVIFAITGDETFAEFHGAFSAWQKKKDTPRAASGIQRSDWHTNISS